MARRRKTPADPPGAPPRHRVWKFAIWATALPSAAVLATVVVFTQVPFYRSFFGATARPLPDLAPWLNLVYLTPAALESLAWVFTLMSVAAVFCDKPSGRYESSMWFFSGLAAVVNAGHQFALGHMGTGLVLGAFSAFGPYVIRKALLWTRAAQDTRTTDEFRADAQRRRRNRARATGRAVLHPIVTGRAVWGYTAGLYSSWDTACRVALVSGGNKQVRKLLEADLTRRLARPRRNRLPVSVTVTRHAPDEPVGDFPPRPETPPRVHDGTVLTAAPPEPGEGELDPELSRLLADLNDDRVVAAWLSGESDQPVDQGGSPGGSTDPNRPVDQPTTDPNQNVDQGAGPGASQPVDQPVDQPTTGVDQGGSPGVDQAGPDSREPEVDHGWTTPVTSGEPPEPAGGPEVDQEVVHGPARPASHPLDQGGPATPNQAGPRGVNHPASQPVDQPTTGVDRAGGPPGEPAPTSPVDHPASDTETTGSTDSRAALALALDKLHEDGTDPRDLSQRDLADALGTSRSTAVRAREAWRKSRNLDANKKA